MLERIAEGVLVHQSELLLNNTVVVQGGSGVLVVDAGITASEMTCLASDLRAMGETVAVGFATHPDWDHVLWHGDLGEDTPRYGTAGCAAYLRELMADPEWKVQVGEGLPPEIADEVPLDWYGKLEGLTAGTTRIAWDGPEVRLIEHPAHAQGHAALLVEESGVLIAGDMLSDVFVPMLDESEDPLGDHLEGLRLLEDAAGAADIVVPGHGDVGRGAELRERIELDRAYVVALREEKDVADPRIGEAVRPGWEWVKDIHTGQVDSLARKGRSRG
ncbi:MBL fold metallo-hydrolase [Streptomyces sp. NPDC050418]|uniref:MBL fold metallo-hydrolase n=1 Tax=Streptomyces sp. NPDC050418 TaxID=3365612 RepID=UPI0037BD475F